MSHIVAIDDDPLSLDFIAETLKLRGHLVSRASGGEAGLSLVREHLPDLVICDINMPGLDGFGVLNQVRADRAISVVPFIILSARSERDDIRKGMALGADDYLTKPFTARELLDAVEAQLKKRAELSSQYETTVKLLRKNIIYALPHELRTPLMGNMGYAELLRMDADKLKPDEVREIAGHIIRYGERLQRIIENYLIYAQIEILSAEPDQIAVLRNHITGNVVDLIAHEIQKTAERVNRVADLVLEPHSPDLALRISTGDLKKIVAELADNAFKFSLPGSPVLLTTGRQNSHFFFCIQDHGRGMTAEQIDAIGAYMQFERALYEQQGLGLGLTIARRLVELHDGEIEFHSELGVGTRVCVRFPL